MASSTSRGSFVVASSDNEVVEVDSTTESKKNVRWNSAMDDCLTETVIEQMHKGYKIDRSFSHTAYDATCNVLNKKFEQKVTIEHVKNRLKTLKGDMAAFQDMEKSASGFSFNRTTRMMDAAPKVWDAYLESHPKARSFRNKKVPCFENLVLLFGADRATGHDAETAKEKRLRLEREKNEAELVFLGDKKVEETKGVSSGPANNEMELSIESSEVPSSSRGSKKRKGGASGGSSIHEEFKMLKSSLDTIASAYGQSTSPRVILEDELFMEVKKIEGLNEDAVLIAYDFICGDPVRGRTFVGLPVNWRKRWLEIKLGCDFGKV